MKLLIIVIAALALCACQSQEDDDLREIINIENKRIKAMLTKDTSAMDEILSPSLVHITTDGSVRDKLEYMTHMSNTDSRFTSFDIEEQDVRFIDDVAIVTGSYTNQKIKNDAIQPKKQAVFTRVYQKLDSGWRLVTHQATRI